MKKVIICIVLLWVTVCNADQYEVDRWAYLIDGAKTALNIEVTTVYEDNTIKLKVTHDIPALKVYMVELTVEDLTLIVDFNRALELPANPMVPIWNGDRESFVKETASFIIDAEYIIIDTCAVVMLKNKSVKI